MFGRSIDTQVVRRVQVECVYRLVMPMVGSLKHSILNRTVPWVMLKHTCMNRNLIRHYSYLRESIIAQRNMVVLETRVGVGVIS